MRLIILALTFILVITNNGNCQIGEAKNTAKPLLVGVADKMVGTPKLEYIDAESGRLYMLIYNNLEYPNIDDIKIISFYANEDELEYLYQFINDSFNTKDQRQLSLGEDEILVQKSSSSLRISVFHKSDTDGWFWLSKKQTNRLFGKR